MGRFTLPRDLYHGKGSLAELQNLKGKRAVIVVGGGSMKRGGFLAQAEQYLRSAGMEVKLFEGVEADPSVETVMRGAKMMQEFEPDWIVAMGGGSPIDAAKTMWAFYEYPDVTFEDLITPFSFPELRQKARFCAIPSTSGTATEVTAFAVITDYQKGVKYPLADFNITPDDAAQACRTYRHGRHDPRDRSLCFHTALQLHRSACPPCDPDDPPLSEKIL